MIIGRMVDALRKANYGALVLEIFVLSVGILLALAVDRWNQDRLDAIETRRIVERLESDTARNLAMFDTTLPGMIENLENLKVFFQALDTGSMTEKNRPMIENAIVGIDVIPSYPLVFSGYEELVATGRLRQLDDPTLIDLLGKQRAEYESAQAMVGYWRDLIHGATDALDEYVDFYFTSERMNEDGMGVRFDFELLAADRNLKNNIFGAVDIHGDWLNAQNRIYEVTKKIDLELKNQPH
jgi:hypothetical protein